MKFLQNAKHVGFASAFGAATLMGLVGFFARNIDAQGDVIAFSRMLCGMILFFILLKTMNRLGDLKKYKLSPSMVFSGLFMGVCLSAYVASTQLTSIANAVFFIYIGPIISTILAIIFLKEPLKPITIFSIAFVFIGMMFIVGLVSIGPEGISFGMSFSKDTFIGDMLGLSSGVGYGLFLFLGRYRTDVPGDVRSFWNFLFALLGICCLFLLTSPSISQMTSSDWLWWIAIGIVCGFGALSLCTIATKNLLAVEFACVSYWECVVASIIGILVFTEPLSDVQMLGGLLIIIGGVSEMAVSLLQNAKKKRVTASL